MKKQLKECECFLTYLPVSNTFCKLEEEKHGIH